MEKSKISFINSSIKLVGVNKDAKGVNLADETISKLQDYFGTQGAFSLNSKVVAYHEVIGMHCDYKNGLGPTIYDPNSNDLIKAFNIDLMDLEGLIDPVKIGMSGIGKPSGFAFLLGVKHSVENDPSSPYALTLILVRLDSKNNIMPDIVIEYCLPCPPTCPTNIDDIC